MAGATAVVSFPAIAVMLASTALSISPLFEPTTDPVTHFLRHEHEMPSEDDEQAENFASFMTDGTIRIIRLEGDVDCDGDDDMLLSSNDYNCGQRCQYFFLYLREGTAYRLQDCPVELATGWYIGYSEFFECCILLSTYCAGADECYWHVQRFHDGMFLRVVSFPFDEDPLTEMVRELLRAGGEKEYRGEVISSTEKQYEILWTD